ncbi:MAG TPA: hypothetical protein VN733_04965 [Solirubrobacterales bacterium]|nr:hypothetical protein [Solirubrobacterales bacterium]
MRRGIIAIVILSLLGAIQLATAVEAATLRPIVYGKAQWEWTGPEGERKIRVWGGLFAAQGGKARQLTEHAGDREPNVSRDGSTIAFVRKGDLYVMGSDGSDQRRLTDGPGLDERPQISPNGRYVLFVRRETRQGPGDLYTVDLAGGQPRALSPWPEDDREAVFSPEGNLIVFVRSLPVPGSVQINDELFAIRPSGTGLVQLTHTSQDELIPRFYARGVVFNRLKTARGGPAAIFTMRRNGTGVKLALKRRVEVDLQAVSPNGRVLVYSSPARGTWTKYLVGRSLPPHRLSRNSSEYLTFSPDGHRVAGAFVNNGSEIAPIYTLSSVDVFTGASRFEGESWELEEGGPVQTSVDSVIGW